MGKMKSEGAKVLQATAGPNVDPQRLVASHNAWARAETDSNVLAGERRQEIGALADSMRLNGKALSQWRAGMKIKSEGQQRDWLYSLEALLAVAKAEILGNQPPLPMSDPEPPRPATEDDVSHMAGGDLPDDAGDLDAEAGEFDAAADALSAPSNVVKAFKK